MILLLLLILLNLFTTLRGIQNIECGRYFSSYNISNGDYAFFRSPNFPKTLSNTTTQTVYCKAQFQTNSGNNLWLAMYNGVTSGIAFTGYDWYPSDAFVLSYNSNYDILTSSTTSNNLYFQLSPTGNPKWTAFESVVLSYNPILNSCPFAHKNITLDSNVIIPIASDFGPEKIGASCDWTFVIGPSQQLKVVIKKQKIWPNFGFTLTTDGNVIENFTSAVTPDDPKIYYFDSTSGIFQFNLYNANSTNANFLAFISKVDNTPASNNRFCESENNITDYVTVSNINCQTGYSTFDSCEHKLSIPSNKELLLHVDDFFIEKNADTIVLTNNSYQANLNNVSYYHLTPIFDGSFMRFSADGSIQQAGFSLHYNIIDCKCADATFVVPCSGGTLFPTSDDHLYCSNLKCNYTLVKDSSCPYDHFTLDLNLKLRDNLDYINVYLYGKFNEKLTSTNLNKKAYSFDSNPLFEFISGDNGNGITDFETSWSIDVSYGLKAPNVLLTHNLTTSSPTYVIWLDDMHFNDAVIVCAPSGNILEMFLSSYSCSKDLSNYGLYDSQSLKNFVINLDSSDICSKNTQNMPSKISSSGCFTLYSLNATALVNTTILFRMKEVHSKNCVGNNVMQVFEKMNSTFSASSTNSGTCEITILSAVTSSPIFGIQFRKFDSSSNAVYNFKSPINQNKMLELKSSDIPYYLPLSFYTPALSIKISNGKSLSFSATAFTNIISVSAARAVLAPPSYYGFAKSYGSPLYFLQSPSPQGTYNFVVKQLNSQWQPYLYYNTFYDSHFYYYFKENDNVTLSNANNELYVDKTDALTVGFLIDFSVPNAQLPASPSPATTTQTSPLPNWFTGTNWFNVTVTAPPKTTTIRFGKLICLTESGHQTCSTSDRYCVYLEGTYGGTYTKFQGCSLYLANQIHTTVCTENEYTDGTTGDDKYKLQCCDTNNCNTGKDNGDNGGNDGTGGSSNEVNLNFGFTSLFIFINYVVLKLLF